jgi:hypothetical protein
MFPIGPLRSVCLSARWISRAAGVYLALWSALPLTPAGGETPDSAGSEFFEKKVRPILVQHCYECHAGAEASGGLLLDSRAGWRKGGDSGTTILPGDAEKSRLIEAVRYKNPDLQMPPKNRLSAADIGVLEAWVSRGAPDPREAAPTSAAPPPSGMSIEDGRRFWSLRPITNPPLPNVQAADWVRSPIDAFTLSRLEQAKLSPAPPADKRTLLRRVTFDLTGLPPTLEETAAFLTDDSPDAFRKVVERLLDSPDYGVRWGRHWLDVARYADSNGLDENLAFGNAWRYRDYVVDAFRRDKPFNQFLIEQLAGDLLPGATPETKTATGFLVLGAKVLAEPDREKLTMDTIDEQLDTLGKAFLGLTFGCARCHDHKFDPIKQSDYYSLAAIFKSTKSFDPTSTGAIKHWHEHKFADEAELAKLKPIDADIAAKKSAAASYKSAAIAKLREAARAKATDYLVACTRFGPGMPLTQVEEIAAPLGLHPHILHRCRLNLEYRQNDPFFARWHELAGDAESIEQHYRPLFAAAETAWAEAKKADPKATKLADANLELARAALYDTEGFLTIPARPEHALDPATLADFNRLSELARIAESTAPDAASAMGVADGEVLASLPVHIRGSHRNLGEPAPRGFPAVMCSPQEQIELPADHSGRLELARWMARGDHPLTARVYVNRVWRWHFGVGLVASTDNFGALGDRPSHPELLDWLASRFVASGWSTKELHRQILNSGTYQMASSHPQPSAALAADPENRLLWKFPLRRLEAESIRDALLAVTGRLERSLGGKSVPLRNRQFVFDHTSIDHTKYDSLRRSLYLPIIRNNLYTLFEQFDYPDPTMTTGSRNATVVAPQALLLLNSDLVLDSADTWAGRLLEQEGDDSQRIAQAYETAFARPPSAAENQRALEFLGSQRGLTSPERRQAWADFCHSLLASNEFIYVR